MEPNKERILLWVEALESGEYSQVEEALWVKDEGYCCLGVACAVAIANGLEVEVTSYKGSPKTMAFDDEAGELPESVQQWYGFTTPDPTVQYTGSELDSAILATEANDSHGWSFEQISQAIRHTYLRGEDA